MRRRWMTLAFLPMILAAMGTGIVATAPTTRTDVILVDGNRSLVAQVQDYLIPRVTLHAVVQLIPISSSAPTVSTLRILEHAALIVYVSGAPNQTVPSGILHALDHNRSATVLDIGESPIHLGLARVTILPHVHNVRILTVAGHAWPVSTQVSVIHPTPRGESSAMVTVGGGGQFPYLMIDHEAPQRSWDVVGGWSTNPLMLDVILRGLNDAWGRSISSGPMRVLWMVGPLTDTTNVAYVEKIRRWFAQHHQSYVLGLNPDLYRLPTALQQRLSQWQAEGTWMVLMPSAAEPRSRFTAVLAEDTRILLQDHLDPLALVIPDDPWGISASQTATITFSTVFAPIAGITMPVPVSEEGITVFPRPIPISSEASPALVQTLAEMEQQQLVGSAMVVVDIPDYFSFAALNQLHREMTLAGMRPYALETVASTVTTPWARIQHRGGRTHVDILDPAMYHTPPIRLTRSQQITRAVSWTITVLVAAVIVLFLRRTVRLRRARGRRQFHETTSFQGAHHER